MARGQTNTVEIIDFSKEPYEPDDIKSKISEKYGAFDEFNHIYLKRIDKNQEVWNLRKYTSLPETDQIRSEFGGGRFELWVHFPDASKPSGRNFSKIPVLIEGEPIIASQNGSKTLPAAPESSDAAEDKALDKIAKYKAIFGGSPAAAPAADNNKDMFTMIITMMKESAAETRELIKSISTKPEDPMLKFFMEKAMEKNSGDLETVLKYKDLFSGAPESEWGWLKEAAPKALELFGAMAMKNNPAAAAALAGAGPVDPNAPPGTVPAGPGGMIGQLLMAVKQIVAEEIRPLKAELNEIKNGIEPIPEGEDQEGADDPGLHIVSEEQTNSNNQPGQDMEAIAAALKAAPAEEKIKQLKAFVGEVGALNTYNWCLQWKVVGDLTEFNKWMKDAGFEELKL